MDYQINKNLILKVAEPQYAEQMAALIDTNREYLKEWLGWLDYSKTTEDSRAFLQNSLENFNEKRSFNTIIFFKGEPVGTAGFNTFDWNNKIGTIGYWLAQGYQGHGIMTETVHFLTHLAFNEFNLNKVEIRAADKNTKSRSIPERLGFQLEGTLRQAEWLYDHFVDHSVYGMLKEEWKS
ncbi:GNAT family N-acetyltransferase [Falsibacillus pallidus]|uniref:GNAT family N-acetyltransferase n=1 Tax=Falsibacillus pallidus TaxID=493781 RepID=UPI003D9630B8